MRRWLYLDGSWSSLLSLMSHADEKTLPSKPKIDDLANYAEDLMKAHRAGDPRAWQRIREFHPNFRESSDAQIHQVEFTLGDAQLAIALEYGFPSWARLKTHIENPSPAGNPNLPHHERIEDPLFRRAVDLLDAGDTDGLRAHLIRHPHLVHQRVTFEGGNYFTHPSLLEFIAENPIRRGSLPRNIVDTARVILDAGANADPSSVDVTLALACSGRVARECSVQVPLIDLLCDYGADPNSGMLAALVHSEFDAVEKLIRRGAKVDFPVATATGRLDNVRALLSIATGQERHLALALAAQYGYAEITGLLLDAGEDPNRYNPVGAHSHSTPLHQAAFYGHEEVVRLLVERGARLDIKDILWQGTSMDWAIHGNRPIIEAYLVAHGAKTAQELQADDDPDRGNP